MVEKHKIIANRQARLLAAVATIITGAVGMFLPVFTGPDVPKAWINVVWGSVYGLGFLIAQSVTPMQPGLSGFAVAIFGMLIWPVGVLLVLYRLLLRVFGSGEQLVKYGISGLLMLSLAWNVQIASIPGTFIERLPLFSAFLDI